MAEEFAPGIPVERKISDPPNLEAPEMWTLTRSRHDAGRAGVHTDMRLVNPKTGIAHSFAIRDLPKPGEKKSAIQTFDHTADYALTFSGRIPSGYGAGIVHPPEKSPIEVTSSRPGIFSFSEYGKKRPEEYTLVKTDGIKWILLNRTPTEKNYPLYKRPKYKSEDISKIPIDNPDLALMPKYDGASVQVHLNPNKTPRIISTREPVGGGIIDHTAKFQSILGFRIPSDLPKTVLRGEVLAVDKKGRFAGAPNTAGILNSETLKARDKIQAIGGLEAFVFDVIKSDALPIDAPYQDKIDFIKFITSKIQMLRPPEVAKTPREKSNLIGKVLDGKHEYTEEGFVAVNLREPNPVFIKHKITPTKDVYIRKVVSGTGKLKNSMGALHYSHTPRGEVVGRVGTGFTDAQRKKIWENRDELIGSVIEIKSMKPYSSGALRMPVFQRIHTSRNPSLSPDLVDL